MPLKIPSLLSKITMSGFMLSKPFFLYSANSPG